jgi:hypothetical protein
MMPHTNSSLGRLRYRIDMNSPMRAEGTRESGPRANAQVAAEWLCSIGVFAFGNQDPPSFDNGMAAIGVC